MEFHNFRNKFCEVLRQSAEHSDNHLEEIVQIHKMIDSDSLTTNDVEKYARVYMIGCTVDLVRKHQ